MESYSARHTNIINVSFVAMHYVFLHCVYYGDRTPNSDVLYCPALERVSLVSYPLARCNNGDPAVYYRPRVHQGPRRAMIYLKGGGVCFPSSQDFKVSFPIIAI